MGQPETRPCRRTTTACQQCDATTGRLSPFVVTFPDGTRRPLLVCRFCYLHLNSAARGRQHRPRGER